MATAKKTKVALDEPQHGAGRHDLAEIRHCSASSWSLPGVRSSSLG